MRKCYCDSCNIEIKQVNVFNYPCHITRDNKLAGYVDNEGNGVSGRMDSIDLCNKCQNVAYTAALDAIGLLD